MLGSSLACLPGAPLIGTQQSQVCLRVGHFPPSINQTDQMLAHLQSFSSVPEHFTLPDSTKSGVPLFYIPPGSTAPVSAHFLGLAQQLELRTTIFF